MKALVTGFDPFGGDEVNPSSLAVGKLKKRIAGIAVHTAELPTSYAKSAGVLRAAIDKVRPDLVLCVGQAGGRSELCLERVGINVQDARIRDNDGKQPIDIRIKDDGPPAYFSSLPIKAMATAMHGAGIPAAVSNTAGTYVCNHIMYQVLYMIDHEFPGKKGGFVHVPYLPSQVLDKPNQPSLGLDELVTALTAGLAAIVEFADKPDLAIVGGALH